MNSRASIITLFLPGAVAVLHAQDFNTESPSQFETPAAYRQFQANEDRGRLTPDSPGYARPNSFLTWGKVTLRPHVNLQHVYNTGLLLAPGETATETQVTSFSPGFLFQIGPRWTLDYTPTFNFISNSRFEARRVRINSGRLVEDSVNHSVALDGAIPYGSWVFSVGQTYSRAANPLIETAEQTDQEAFTTHLGASHYFDNKFNFEASIGQSIRQTDAFSSSSSLSTMEWLNYQILPTVAVGVGVGGGYESVESASDMSYQQLLARISARVARRVSLSVSGGQETRQLLGNGSDSLNNPIYNAAINYQPFDYTTLSLSGSRAVRASILAGQITETSTISVAMNQRLLGAVFLTLSGSYRNTTFLLSNASLVQNRSDDSTTLLARLGYPFSNRATGSIFYQFSDNRSSDSNYAFHNTQIGIELSYHF